jgi:stage IV sporulation protein FB
MRDPISWSFPVGRLFGVTIRIHVFLPLLMLALVLKATTQGVSLGEASLLMAILFASVLLHELGHCFAARAVDGDASEMLLWPLGGLAYCDLPHTPKAHFVCAAGGPAVTAILALISGSALLFCSLTPPLNPLESPYQPRLWNWRDAAYRTPAGPSVGEAEAPSAKTEGHFEITAARPAGPQPLAFWQVIAAQVFWLNWVGFILNLLPGFPLDGGRMTQAVLWWQSGDYRASMATASYAGFIVMLIIAVFAVVGDSVLGLCLALFIYVNCKQQLIMLESGGEESPFGYDFSQGYTSLEGAAPAAPPRRKRLNFWQRWLQKRTAKRAQRDIERRESEDRRMDELLDKVQTHGFSSLTDEERRFLVRVSARYRGKA